MNELTIFIKCSILDVWQGSLYISEGTCKTKTKSKKKKKKKMWEILSTDQSDLLITIGQQKAGQCPTISYLCKTCFCRLHFQSRSFSVSLRNMLWSVCQTNCENNWSYTSETEIRLAKNNKKNLEGRNTALT